MNTALYWFRNDLRLHDNPALMQACAQADALLPVFCLGSASAARPDGAFASEYRMRCRDGGMSGSNATTMPGVG